MRSSASETSISPQNYGGTFTCAGGLGPALDAGFQPLLDPAGQPQLTNISSLESYRRTLSFQQAGLTPARIRQLGGGASQFSINAGTPTVRGSQADLGLYAGDDWKLRSDLILSLGLRYETQTNIHDWTDFAPRIGIAWAPAGGAGRTRPKSVVRAGFGMFYDRFALANVLTAQRYNGALQQQYFVANPDFFPALPPVSALPGPLPASTIQEISPTLHAPYLMQSAVSFERQIPFNTTVAVTYANSHGLHLLRSRALPLVRPGLFVLMESSGLYNQNQLLLNVNSQVNKSLSLTGSYAYGYARGNTDGLGTFPANPNSMTGEYGPAAIDMRHRASLSGTISLKWGLRFNPLITANTGPPFDITAGRDIYGNTLFNGRPALATNPDKPGVVNTPYGLLDPNPAPGQQILSRNYGRGPGQIMVNLRVARTFTFGSREGRAPVSTNPGGISTPGGPAPATGEPGGPFAMGRASTGPATANRRYSMVLSMQIRNLTNHNNPGIIIGSITSPLFGRANQPAGSGNAIFAENANNRRMELQMRLTF